MVEGATTYEKAKFRRETVRPQPSLHGGVVVRLPKVTMKDLLYDFHAYKQLLSGTDLDEEILKYVDGQMEEIQVVSFPCPYHGYIHIQLVPVNKEPMSCAEAGEDKP